MYIMQLGDAWINWHNPEGSSSMNLDRGMTRRIKMYIMRLGDAWVNGHNCIYLDLYKVDLN